MAAPRKKTATRKNLFGFGKQETFSRSIQDAERAAYGAGQAIADDIKHFSARGKASHISKEFRAWLKKQKLSSAGSNITRVMEREFKSGATGRARITKAPSGAEKQWNKKADTEKGIRETTTFKGVKLFKVGSDGEYTTSIDKDSHFDSLKDAKAFIDSWKKGRTNPNKKPAAKKATKKTPLKRLDEKMKKAGAKVTRTKSGKRQYLFPKNKRRTNPEDLAEQAYRDFTGRDAEVVMELEERLHVHRSLWTVGRLIAWDIVTVTGKRMQLPMPGFTERRSGGKPYWDHDESLSAADTVWLGANEKYKDEAGNTHAAGTQLFVKGGDQSIDLESLGLDPLDAKENTFIGTIEKVWYRQRKTFEGDEETDFHHAFGKEGSKGVLPILLYHPRSEHMTVAGGRYQIAKPEGALGGVSPGIIG